MADTTTTEKREFLPEVQAYIEAAEAAEKAYEAANKAAEEKYPNRYHWSSDTSVEERRGFERDLSAARKQYATVTDDAWEEFGKSEDPFVRWIAQHCTHYKRYAVTVLKALPAKTEQLNELAEANEWCEDWEYLRDKAIDAGVLAPLAPESPARRKVTSYLRDYGMGQGHRRELGRLLDALVAEAKAEAPQAAAA